MLEEDEGPKLEELVAMLGDSDIDGIPLQIDATNRQTFIAMYCKHELIIKRQAFLNEVMVGLNHYGVSYICFCLSIFNLKELIGASPVCYTSLVISKSSLQ